MPNAGRRYEEARKTLELGAQAQVHVFEVGAELFIQSVGVLEELVAVHGRRSGRPEDPPLGIPWGTEGGAVADLEGFAPAREAVPGAVDPAGVTGVEHERSKGARIGSAGGGSDELVDPRRLRLAVVVEQGDEGAASHAQAGGGGGCETLVLLELERPGSGKDGAYLPLDLWAGTVEDDDDLGGGSALPAKGTKAAPNPGRRTSPRWHDDADGGPITGVSQALHDESAGRPRQGVELLDNGEGEGGLVGDDAVDLPGDELPEAALVVDRPDVDGQPAEVGLADEVGGHHAVVGMQRIGRDERDAPRSLEDLVLEAVVLVRGVEEADRHAAPAPDTEQRKWVEGRDDRLAAHVHRAEELGGAGRRAITPGILLLDLDVEAEVPSEGLDDLGEGRHALGGESGPEPRADVDLLEIAEREVPHLEVLATDPHEVEVVHDDDFTGRAGADVEFDPVGADVRGVLEGGEGVLGGVGAASAMGVDLDRRRLRGLTVFAAFAGGRPARAVIGHGGRARYPRRVSAAPQAGGLYRTVRDPRGRALRWLGAALSLGLVASPGSAAAGEGGWLHGEVDGDVEIDTAGRGARIQGALRYRLRIDGPEPLSQVAFFRYPSAYEEPPAMDDLLAERFWWHGPSAGSMHLRIEAAGPCDEGIAWPVAAPGAVYDVEQPAHTVVELASPVASGTTLCVLLTFETVVPEIHGSFGEAARQLTVSGGLIPHPVAAGPGGTLVLDALPAPLSANLRLRLPTGWTGLLSDHVLGPEPAGFSPPLPSGVRRSEADERGVSDVRTGARPFLTLSAGPERTLQSLPVDGGEPVLFSGRPLRPRQRQWIRETARNVAAVLRNHGLPETGPILLAEAPLRRALVEDGHGVILVSDRYLELAEPFWRFHDVHLARAMLAQAVERRAAKTEPPSDLPLIVHGASWWLVEDYLRRRWARHVGLRTFLQRLSFLPAIDDLLETPAFPFADQIYDDPWTVDPLRADIRRWNRPLRSGRTLFLRLEDLVGAATLRGSLATWAENPTLRLFPTLEDRTGVAVGPTVAAFQSDPPIENLRIAEVRRRGEHATIVVERTGGEVVGTEAPVEVRVAHRDGRARGELHLRWDGQGDRHRWDVHAPWPIGSVEVDPRGRSLERGPDGLSAKTDNRDPAPLRLSGYAYFVALSANLGAFDAYATLQVRRAGDLKNHLLLRVFANERVRLGGGATWLRYFGRPRAGRRYEHRLAASFDVDWLDTRYAATVAPLLLEGRLSWTWDGRAYSFTPTRGGRAFVSLFGGRDLVVGLEDHRPVSEAGYLGFDSEAVRLFPLAPRHVLAAKFRFGAAVGNVRHRQFDLGGLEAVRGVPEGHHRGAALLAGTVEWRHTFARDLDVRLPLMRLRGIQGALFVEAGSVFGRADGAAPGAAVGVGYGLRAFVDLFGFLPGAGGIDFAWSPGQADGAFPIPDLPSRWPRVPFQVYLIGSQSF